ncbi:Aste57867_11201 [Aphanomyces stellatus]|uniref:Aste57867_11201 protein n=1 Tax=Aphanomyces stellatus TaxID=120398 RepID=A0A485KSU0_9STRA|nr:hypothetical protein As57867_011159 [Aphanomyces stellatus]VFT88068.1 Aste57867_11201 [Aphanomyces stellatus]
MLDIAFDASFTLYPASVLTILMTTPSATSVAFQGVMAMYYAAFAMGRIPVDAIHAHGSIPLGMVCVVVALYVLLLLYVFSIGLCEIVTGVQARHTIYTERATWPRVLGASMYGARRSRV